MSCKTPFSISWGIATCIGDKTVEFAHDKWLASSYIHLDFGYGRLNMSYNIFISYRRDGGSNFATILHYLLAQDGFLPFLDKESLHQGAFTDQLYNGIAESDFFLLILSPKALDRCKNKNDWVSKEIHKALDASKTIIPIMLNNFTYPSNLPDELNKIKDLQAIELKNDFDAMYAKLKKELLRKSEEHQKIMYTKGNMRRDGDFVYFGVFPQTIMSKDVELKARVELYRNEVWEDFPLACYLGSDNEYYVKMRADPCGQNNQFSTTAKIEKDKCYYFKIEPIKWRILHTDDDDKLLLLCEDILTNMYFDSVTECNNYENSEIRHWLRDVFYEVAFNDEQRKLVKQTLVDNSVRSTNPNKGPQEDNPYICDDTNDYVFLLSEQEVTDESYGFKADHTAKDDKRCKKNSDYARCLGAWTSRDQSNKAHGRWWLRSPYFAFKRSARDVNECGVVNDDFDRVFLNNIGVAPAIWVQKPTHEMHLAPSSFEKIKKGTKTIELRLYDDKRQQLRVGDIIEFVNNKNEKQRLTAEIVALMVFDSFETLYRTLPLSECGYAANEIASASPTDMNKYYSIEQQQQYGVVGIKIRLV